MKAIEVTCPHCGAEPGASCHTASGKVCSPHLTRHDAVVTAPRSERAQAKLPSKLKHRVRAHAFVWCDVHGTIHPAQVDYYGECDENCQADLWRRVYIETDDKDEMF